MKAFIIFSIFLITSQVYAAGDKSINWINSTIIPGMDDGKVSIESARIEGMADFLIVHVPHPFIMNDKTVMTECVHFLRNGHFKNRSERKF